MGQSERERALALAEEGLWWHAKLIKHNPSRLPECEYCIRIAAYKAAAALDTPQEPTPAPSQAEVEAGQRKRLKERLAGRPRPPREAFEDIGIPMLNEWADNSVPTIETSHEQPTPAAPPGLEKFLSELEVEAGDYNRRFEESTKRQEYITAAQQGGVAAAYRNVVIRLRALAAAPRPALSPDALRQLIAEWRAEARKNIPDDYTKRHLEHKYLKLDNYASGLDDCADVLEDLLRAPAPREGACAPPAGECDAK